MPTPATDPVQSRMEGHGEDTVATPPIPTEAPSQADVPEGSDMSLASLEAVMGRKFTSLDEAKKHYHSLTSLVGDQTIADQRKRAGIAENLAKQVARENGWSLEASYAYLERLQEGRASERVGTPDISFDPKQAETDARMRKLERELFLGKNPGAAKVIDKLDDYVRTTGKSLDEAYSFLYGDVVQEIAETVRTEAKRSEKKNAGLNVSPAAPAPPQPNLYEENMKLYQKTGKKEFFHEAIKHRWNNNDGLKRRTASTNQT